MEKYCVFCGSDLNEDEVCPNNHSNRKMCINCDSCEVTNGAYFCKNSEIMEEVYKKMFAAADAVSNGAPFELTIKTLPIKLPINRCSKWSLNPEIIEMFKESFV